MEDYIPYGEEWIKEMSKLPKDAILRMFSKMGIEKNQEYQQLKNSKTQCTGDRDCEELKKEIKELEQQNKYLDELQDQDQITIEDQSNRISELEKEVERLKGLIERLVRDTAPLYVEPPTAEGVENLWQQFKTNNL